VSSTELPLPSIASLRAVAALKSAHLAEVRPARIGLGFEAAAGSERSWAEIEALLGGPGRLPLPYSLRWLLDAAAGLGVLHRTLGFVHGEVQPSSLVLGADGIGRLVPVVRAHWARGEERPPEQLYYLAPERLLGDSVDVRADVYGFGVLLWEALAGRPLLEADSTERVIAWLMGSAVTSPQTPATDAWTAPLGEIALRALAVDPARRFASLKELAAAIESVAQGYLATPAAMAELFHDPLREHQRELALPDSQRVTLQKEHASPPSEAQLEAAAERLSRSSLLSADFEEELTTRVQNTHAVATRAPSHVSTLLGVTVTSPPGPSVFEELTPEIAPRGSSLGPVVIPTVGPSASAPPPPLLPFGKTRTQFGLPEPTRPEHRLLRAAELEAAEGAVPASAPAGEPSFGLLRPRRRYGVTLLSLVAAATVAVLLARPWVGPEPALNETAATPSAAPPPAGEPAEKMHDPSSPPTTKPLVSIADTPAMPTARARSTARAARQPHAALVAPADDAQHGARANAEVPASEGPLTTPQPDSGQAESPSAVGSPPPPPPAAKPRRPPTSAAERYGI
jgi:hypothetical protein